MNTLIDEFEKQLTARRDDKSKTGEACLVFLEKLEESQAAVLLAHAMGFLRFLPNNEEENKCPGLTGVEWALILKRIGDSINKTMLTILDQDGPVAEKMTKIWRFISRQKDRQEKIFTLTCLLYGGQPLLLDEERLGTVTISDEEFKQIVSVNTYHLHTASVISHAHTDLDKRASALLNLLADIDDRKVRVVTLTNIKRQPPSQIDTLFGTLEFEKAKGLDLAEINELKADKACLRKMTSAFKVINSDELDQQTERFGAALHLIESETELSKRIVLMATVIEAAKSNASPMTTHVILGR